MAGDDQAFADRLNLFGESRAVALDDGLTVSYRELTERADLRGQELGQPRCLVLLGAELSLESVVTYLAALRGRHPVILADPDHAHAHGELATLFRPDVVASSDGSLQRLEWHDGRVALHSDLAVLLSTSGSTGSTKLVRLSHENIQSNANAIRSYLQLSPGDAGALTLPLHYSYGLSVLNSHLAAGAALCIWRRPLTDPELVDWLASVGCTNISGVPYSYEIFERIGLRHRAWDQLRFMTAAGGRLPPETVRTYAEHFRSRGGRFFVMYGQTEATARIAYVPPDQAGDHADCIGIAIPGGDLRIVDEQGHRIERPLTAGELVYRGPNVMMGYATTPADLAKGRELAELQTGDLGERTEAGFIRIVGRKSRFSKLSGLRVSHDEIERHLSASGIAAAVTGDDRHLIVAVTGNVDAAAVTRHIMAVTSVQPSQVRVKRLDAIPRLRSGKVDYPAVSQLAADEKSTKPGSVLAAFSKAFWPSPVNPDDTFLSLGGDSLTFVQLVIELDAVLGRAPDRWERMTVAELSAAAAAPAAAYVVDPNVYIRAAAILLVVFHHLYVGIQGGAFVLMTMVGYSLARFQSPALFRGQSRGVLRRLLRNLLAYFAVLVPLMAWQNDFRWPDLLLLSNVIGFPGEPMLYNVFWFVEAYAWILISVILLFKIPPLRQAASRRPLSAGMVALAAAVLLVFAGRITWNDSWNSCSQGACVPVTEVAYWAAIGWCLYFARTQRDKVAALAVAAFTVLMFDYVFYDGVNGSVAVYLAPLPLLAWRVQLRLPAVLSAALSYLAVNSYAIYLLHLIPIVVAQQYGFSLVRPGFAGELLPLAAGISFPLAVAAIVRVLVRFARRGHAAA